MWAVWYREAKVQKNLAIIIMRRPNYRTFSRQVLLICELQGTKFHGWHIDPEGRPGG